MNGKSTLVDLRGRISQRITAREDGVRGPSNYGPDNVFSTELSTARETPNHPFPMASGPLRPEVKRPRPFLHSIATPYVGVG